MKDLLVGSTGFVGQNLIQKHTFEAVCHSTDVNSFYGTNPELCVYSGVPAAMFLANQDPEADLALMQGARENLQKINPKKVVLISSIAVFPDSRGKDEDAVIDPAGLPAYGRNRLQLENWVREDFPDATVLRLPALYGTGLKKNFLFDLHTITPALLRTDKFEELAAGNELIREAYEDAGNGFYRCRKDADRKALYAFFSGNDFNALSFTDSRSRYQFYHLNRLWQDICTAVENDLSLLHIATPPVTAKDVYEAVTGKTGWENHLAKSPFDYDLRTKHGNCFASGDGYLISKEEEMQDICEYMRNWQ